MQTVWILCDTFNVNKKTWNGIFSRINSIVKEDDSEFQNLG